jgi:SAM-dependent methyltransferase
MTEGMSCDPYALAKNHYTSRHRLDYVKLHWERPQFEAILYDSIAWLFRGITHPELHVVDIGAGAGEGFELIRTLSECLPKTVVRYYALDQSQSMLSAAQSNLGRYEGCVASLRFLCADVREFDFSPVKANLFLSIGVPYSHLEETEMVIVLERIFRSLETNEFPSVVIIDVLGRYSVEWLPLARDRRRTYTMSFFSEVTSPPVALMTFYSRNDLSRIITESISADMRKRLVGYNFWDRSVFVGRHTSTCLYNNQMPRMRSLINEIASTDRVAPSAIERLKIPTSAIEPRDVSIPEVITSALSSLSGEWNRIVRDATAEREVDSHSLCASLKSVDQGAYREGLGIGHSLTAVLKFEGKR